MKQTIKVGDKLRVISVDGLSIHDKLKVGQIVTCTGLTHYELSDGSIGVYVDGMGFYYSHRFEHVEDASEIEMSKQIEHAKSLIGKKVQFDGATRIVNFAGVAFAKCGRLSPSVNKDISTYGFCVYVKSEEGCSKPAKRVEFIPTSITVKLNGSYDAVVTEKTIKVGCQEFSVDILSELVAAHKKIAH